MSKIYVEEHVYEFQCLPFGLSGVPRVIIKLLKPVLGRLRHHGVRLILNLDEMLLMAHSQEELKEQLQLVISLLGLLGFVINQKKSQLLSTQLIQYLGFLVDSTTMRIRLTEEKNLKMVVTCRAIQEKLSLSVRKLAKL